MRVDGLKNAKGPEGDRAREAAANLEQWAKQKKVVSQVIGPTGWRERGPSGEMEPKMIVTKDEIDTCRIHRNHYHLTIKREGTR